MKKLKKILKISAIVFLLLIGFLFAAPYLFKSQIVAFVKEQVNKNLNARVDFTGVDISFFRHFPKVAVALEELSVVGLADFAADTLLGAQRLDAAVNLMSVIKGKNMTIYSITVEEPRIHALVHANGAANWDIAKPSADSSETAATSKPFQLSLEKYSIRNGYILYKDEASNIRAELRALNHEGSGDFNAERFLLHTSTQIEALSVDYGGIPYLVRTQTGLDADVEVDNSSNTYKFKTDKINLNALVLNAAGFFQLANDSTYNMDISFNAPSTDFKNILSLVPVVYAKDFEKIKTSGQALFKGFVKGTYSNQQMPAYSIDLAIKDGFFQYPDLPKPLKQINLTLQVNNPDGISDHTIVNIPSAHLELDQDPFDFRLLVKTPESNLFIDAAAKGKLDLAQITELVKLEPGTKLSGLLNADVRVKGAVAAIQAQQLGQFDAAGSIDLSQFYYASPEYPDGLALEALQAAFNPKNVQLKNIKGKYQQTQFEANGQLNNLLLYALKDEPLDGLLNVKADKVNLNQLMGVAADTATTSTASTENSKPFAVPANIKFVVNAAVEQVTYDRLDLRNLSGSLVLANETVSLKNIKGNTLDGSMLINGSYSTAKNKEKPAIALTYDVKDLDVEKTFYTFNTVQKLMPIGKFIAGKINSQLSMNGSLGDNMMPDLSSLTGNGTLFLIEGFLSKFKPLEQLAQQLNIKELEKISVKDVKNYIEFTNGQVMVKPFKTNIKGIELEIGGFHGFDQSLDYTINLNVPRSMMGEKGNNYVNGLISQVNAKGVPLKIGELVPIQVKLTGFINSPQLKTDLKQSATNLAEDLKEQAVEFAKAKIDSTKTAVKEAARDSLESAKKQVVKAAEDELRKKLLGGKDSSGTKKDSADPKKKLEETGKGLIKGILGRKKKDSSNKN